MSWRKWRDLQFIVDLFSDDVIDYLLESRFSSRSGLS
jgi:hypothetical protein